MCHVPSVTCSMSGFMRHMSLVTNNNDHIHKPSPPNFPIIHNRLIHRGVAQKKEENKLKKLKINETEKKIVRLCDCTPKLAICPLGVSQWHIQTDTHTHGHGNSMTNPAQRAELVKNRDLGKKFSGH